MQPHDESLPHGLQTALIDILHHILAGTLNPREDFGTERFVAFFSQRNDEEAELVRQFLDAQAQRSTLTDGVVCGVVFADTIYVKYPPRGGLLFALVSLGEDASSPSARYFGIDSSRCSADLFEAASPTEIQASRDRLADSTRRRAQRESGEVKQILLLNSLRERVLALWAAHDGATVKADDLEAVTGYDSRRPTLPDRVPGLNLEQLCTILAILGDTELPQYPAAPTA